MHIGLLRGAELLKRHFGSFYRHATPAKVANFCSLYAQRLMGRSSLTAYPIEIIVDPTNACHLRCPLCPTGQRANARRRGMMPFERFKDIVDELAPWLFKVRLYNWGEPLMHRDIHRMIANLTARNVGSEISSHLNIFAEKDAEALVGSGLEKLIVSLDGADQETYATYRRGGDFSKVVGNITAIVSERERQQSRFPLIELQVLAMRHNESQLREVVALGKKLKVEHVRVGAVTVNLKNRDDWTWLPADERLSRYSYHEQRDRIYSRRRKCEWLWRSAVINWDGTVSPCCVFEGSDTEMGVLGADGFAGVWNNANYRAAREVFTRGTNGTRVLCASCKGMPAARSDVQHGLY